MPSKRPYPPEHYPKGYFDAVKSAVACHNAWFDAAEARDSKEAARVHTKLKAMLKHVETFAGQDPKIVDAVRNQRLHVRKHWDGKAKIVYVRVCMYSRPSEEADASFAAWKQGLRSTPF